MTVEQPPNAGFATKARKLILEIYLKILQCLQNILHIWDFHKRFLWLNLPPSILTFSPSTYSIYQIGVLSWWLREVVTYINFKIINHKAKTTFTLSTVQIRAWQTYFSEGYIFLSVLRVYFNKYSGLLHWFTSSRRWYFITCFLCFTFPYFDTPWAQKILKVCIA